MCLAGSINIPGLGGEIGLIKPIWVAGGGGQAGSHMDAFRQGGMGGTGGADRSRMAATEPSAGQNSPPPFPLPPPPKKNPSNFVPHKDTFPIMGP